MVFLEFNTSSSSDEKLHAGFHPQSSILLQARIVPLVLVDVVRLTVGFSNSEVLRILEG